jgi:hypothetical protein
MSDVQPAGESSVFVWQNIDGRAAFLEVTNTATCSETRHYSSTRSYSCQPVSQLASTCINLPFHTFVAVLFSSVSRDNEWKSATVFRRLARSGKLLNLHAPDRATTQGPVIT